MGPFLNCKHFGTLVTTPTRLLLLILVLLQQEEKGTAQQIGPGGEIISGGGSWSSSDCPFGMYGMPRGGNEEEACVCLRQGLWAVMTDYCTVPVEMHGVGGVGRRVCVLKEGKGRRNTSSGGGQIQQLSKLLTLAGPPEAVQLSSSMHKLIERFDPHPSVILPDDVYPMRPRSSHLEVK
ncbi:hypothetical protein Fcan01_13997 [Folsomia candida]|uniref:Uncharacterized protein n=1 Tax=Folsomia candida TaxID=158441 RepID=A0A226E0R0_FOLCA|nr:hypothetical protein Fcan01_13997 [Folsomia candida]